MKNITAHWRYSTKCNLDCEFCFALPDSSENINIDEKKIVDKILEAGFEYLIFTGGEPTTRKEELLEIIPYAYKKGLKIEIDTNGSYLDDNLMKVIKESNVTLGLPLYSAKPEIHNNLVKNGEHYKTVIALLEKASKMGIKTKINTMVSKKNKDDFLDIGKIIEKYNVSHWNMLRFKPYRRALLSKEDYNITESEFLDIIKKVKDKHPSVKIIGHTKNEDSKRDYFFITRNGKVIQPIENGKERFIGDLINESAEELVQRINIQNNKMKTIVERVANEGMI